MTFRIVIALLLPFLTCGIQWLFWQAISPYVWFLFFPTIFFSSRIGGKAAGLVSTVMSAAIVVYVFIPPQLSLSGKNPSNLISVGVFLLMGGLFSYTHERLEAANRRASEAQESARSANEKLQEAMISRLQVEHRQVEKNLIQSEERLRLALDAASEGLWDWDLKSKTVYRSQRYYELVGRRPAEGSRECEFFTSTVHPDDRPGVQEAMDAHLLGRSPAIETEYRLASDSGDVKWMKVKGRVVERDECGTPLRLVGTLSDVTARKRIEFERDATLELLRICNTADRLPDLMQELMSYFKKVAGCEAIGLRLRDGVDYPYYDTHGLPEEFVHAERHLCSYDHTGGPARDEAGQPVLDCLCGSVISGSFDPSHPCFTSHGSFWISCSSEMTTAPVAVGSQAKHRYRCLREGYESIALIPLRYHNESFGLFQFIDREKGRFTPEKIALVENLVDYFAIALSKLKSDESLRESQQFNQQVFDHAEEGIVVYGTDLRYRGWNPYMERLSGLAAHDVIGKHPLELFPFLDDRGVMESLESALNGQPVTPIEFSARHPGSGFSGWLSNTPAPLRSGSGEITGVIAMVRDITARKRTEEELRKRNEDMEQFIYTTSHDLRTPLVTIKTFIGFLENDLITGNLKQVAQDLQFINSAADKMKMLLDGLLELSRVDRLETQKGCFSLAEILDDVLAGMAGFVSERNAEIRLPETDLMLCGDRERLRQLWQNLIENAIKFARDGSAPLVELGVLPSEPESEAVFFVRDNGIGVDTQYGARIFKIFEKLDPGSPGSGMGLCMVQRIVEKSGGRVWVESEGDGAGACFCFTLPNALEQSRASA